MSISSTSSSSSSSSKIQNHHDQINTDGSNQQPPSPPPPPQQQQNPYDDQHHSIRQSRNLTFALRQIRLTLSPYLPPPVVSLLHTIDHHPQILKCMTSSSSSSTAATDAEPSMMIFSTLFLIYILKNILSMIVSQSKRKSTIRDMILHDAPEDQVLNTTATTTTTTTKDHDFILDPYCKDTVILFGPSGSGKSLLFYKIANMVQTLPLHGNVDNGDDSDANDYDTNTNAQALQENIDTVMSLKANVQIISKGRHSIHNPSSSSSSSVGSQGNSTSGVMIRLVDYPGHKTLFAKLLGLLLPTTWNGSGSGNIRALLVVDSTKSVGEAAWILYKILTHGKFVQEWNDKTTTTTTTKNNKKSNDKGGLQIMVVCNKNDESNAKNWRRIKIQLRNELDALRKVSTCCVVSDAAAAATAADHDEEEFLLTGKSIDLDDLSKNGVKGVKLSFMSYSAKTGNGWKDLCDFVMSGTLPQVDSGRILDRRK